MTVQSGKTTRQKHVLDTLRGEIVAGVYPPGGRLPVQTELTARFKVGSSTVAQALAVLGREGFVTSRRGAGCAVCENPPHLHNIVVAVPQRHAPDRHWSNYYVTMTRVASDLRAELGRPIRLVEELEDRAGESHLELNGLVRAHRVAGIVFVNPPNLLEGSAILEEPGIPRVEVAATPSRGVNARVALNGRFIEKALDYLLGRGRRNIALLTSTSGWDHDHGIHIRNVLASSNAHCPPHWQIPVHIETPQTAQSVVRLLMHGHERPDALIVTDDNLVDDAVAGLVVEGVRVPDDLEVVAHCNFPWPPTKALPIRRLGPDIGEMMRESIAAIDRLRRGQAIPAVIECEAVWETERHEDGGPWA
jgi:DNA-binding LacI/PurR family transcriptional regulator